MIDIVSKYDCCGCDACEQICPTNCISMNEDEEGFEYPLVDLNLCIHCNLCEKVCPVIHQSKDRKPLNVYAAKNNNHSIWVKSSSGGVFSPIAEEIIKNGGVVFGAAFDDSWNVKHISVDKIEDLGKLRKSKYVQSSITKTFIEAREYLRKGTQVLFVGTHCQIAGLHLFLRKKYDNLLTVDVLCHGVPSPKIWRDYLSSISGGEKLDKVSFRHKEGDTQKYLSVLQNNKELCGEDWCDNLYIQGFLRDIYLRPSCYKCPSRKGKSGADLTLADYWGIENILPNFGEGKSGGTSLILVYSERGKKTFENLGLEFKETSYEDALKGNPAIEQSANESKYKKIFWELYQKKGLNAISIVVKKIKKSKEPSFFAKIKISARYRGSLMLKKFGLK